MLRTGAIGINVTKGFHNNLVKMLNWRLFDTTWREEIAHPNQSLSANRLPGSAIGMGDDGIPTAFPADTTKIPVLFIDSDVTPGMTTLIDTWIPDFTPGLMWSFEYSSAHEILSTDAQNSPTAIRIDEDGGKLTIKFRGYNGTLRQFPPKAQFYINIYPQGADPSQFVNQKFVDYYAKFRTDPRQTKGLIRAMSPFGTNGPSDEPSMTVLPTADWITWQYSKYSAPPPVEVLIEMADRTGLDPFYNIPPNADNETIVRQIAADALEAMPAGMNLVTELGNELWNTLFGQTIDMNGRWAVANGLENTGTNRLATRGTMYTQHAREVLQRLRWFKAVFDEVGQGARCLPVIGWHSESDYARWASMLSESKRPDGTETGRPLWMDLWGVAIAPYNAHSLGSYTTPVDEIPNRDILLTDPALFEQQAWAALEGSLYKKMLTVVHNFVKNLRTFALSVGQAPDYFTPVCYEYNAQHILVQDAGQSPPGGPDATYIDAARKLFAGMNRSARMGALVNKQTDLLLDLGFQCVFFQGPSSLDPATGVGMQYGKWGLTNALDDFGTEPGASLFSLISNPPAPQIYPLTKGLMA